MKIAELFPSLQGEGKNQGRPCFFVRLAGCNLRCRWCDTPASWSGGDEMSPEMVAGRVMQADLPYVCITGGEPLLQGEELGHLLTTLHRQGIAIDIETNGTVDFSRFQQYASVCMDVKCPSSGEKSDLSLLAAIRPQDSVKFVVKDDGDCRYAREVMAAHAIAGEIFFSPVYGSDYRPIIQFILAGNLPVRFQLQLHKILGVK
jgi:7-carboxy-7-deazaguanine synthase